MTFFHLLLVTITMDYEIIFRVIFITAFFMTISISAWYRWQARKSGEAIPRRNEGSGALAARTLLGLILLSFILAYPFFPGWIQWSKLHFPLWIRWIGSGLALLCPLLSIWVFKNIGKNISETVLTKQDHQLVTSGPYRWIRHPLYTTGILLILSFGIIAANWIFFLFTILTSLIFRFFIIPKEEARLTAKFGELYKNYKRVTGALLPKFLKN